MGAFWQGSTEASQTSFFDNVYLKGPTAPGAPTITSITPSNGQLAVNFNAPSSNGGSTITNYKYSKDNGTTFTAVSPSQTSSPIYITGLTNGITYDIVIRAVNVIGDGTSSMTMQGSPINVIALPVVGSPVVSNITTTSATLGGTINSNGGELLSARGTVWGTSPNPTGNMLTEGGNSIGTFIHSRIGFIPNTFYYYRGYATNSAGTSYSPSASFTTKQNTPTVGSGSNATMFRITSNWSAPTGGGSASFTYEVQISNSPTFATILATQSNISSSILSYQFTGLTQETIYYFRVRANNASGSSAWSNPSIGYSTTNGCIKLNSIGIIYSENFNTLAISGDSDILPNGWFFHEQGTASNFYTGDNGSSNIGNAYSYGSTSNPERC
jgi:hypothetical protein